jgi:ATP-dependent Clp protease adaptor protein ClpS
MVRQKDKPALFDQSNSTLQRGIILYNDDVNSFDFVIETLVEVCHHEPDQAEQCALITHFKGKCNVKTGDYYEMKPIYDEMTFRGLTVSIE